MTSGPELGCGYLPGRKSPCLYLVHEGRITPLAWFVSGDAYDLWAAAAPTYSSSRLHEAVTRGTLTP